MKIFKLFVFSSCFSNCQIFTSWTLHNNGLSFHSELTNQNKILSLYSKLFSFKSQIPVVIRNHERVFYIRIKFAKGEKMVRITRLLESFLFLSFFLVKIKLLFAIVIKGSKVNSRVVFWKKSSVVVEYHNVERWLHANDISAIS